MISARYARPLRATKARESKPQHSPKITRQQTRVASPSPFLALVLEPVAIGRRRILDALGQSVLVHLMLAMTFVALAALLYLAQASQSSVLQFNIADLQFQRSQLNARNASLQATVNSLRSPNRIDALASGKLHMIRPNLTNTVWISPVAPRVSTQIPANEVRDASKQSQPAASVADFLRLVASSL